MQDSPESPKKGVETRSARGFLVRLAQDSRGNTLALVGAALIPLLAMIGSGVDMSRAYMAKTRLQSACDAAALAGRRVMQNDSLGTNVAPEATKFFNFNFPQGLYQTAAFTPSVTRPSSGTVRVSASTTIPTAIMKIFGYRSLPLSVTCDASLNFVNTDVMLVLDTTGSMDQDVNGNNTSVTADKKITALKDAVMALYDALAPTQTQLEANGLRMRYGIVPYSSSVNVGALIRAVNSSYLADSVPYQSRVANYNQVSYPVASTTTSSTYFEYYTGSANPQTSLNAADAVTGISQANCLSFMKNQNFTGFTKTAATNGATAPATLVTHNYISDGQATSTDEWGWSGAPVNTSNSKSCRRYRTDTTTTYNTVYTASGSNSWTYQQTSIDTSQFKLGNAVTISTNTGGSVTTAGWYDPVGIGANATGASTTTDTWNGCIEERQTVNTIDSTSGYSIPSGAYDLNIDFIPNNAATQWRPQWDTLEYLNAGSSGVFSMNGSACPTAAKRLQAWTRSDLQNYVDTLTPAGSTYHDIGMIWGARMISNAGVFADSPDTYNGIPVTRHIIFMTDGIMQTSPFTYSSYGVEYNDHRVVPSNVTINTNSYPTSEDVRHLQRFKMICNAVKGKNVSIWVIAFGASLTPELTECASNSNQAATAANRDALIAKFTEIGNNIGALRLTQ